MEVVDLNLPSADSPEVILRRKLSDMQPDIVGFSMSYDVSYSWLKSLAEMVKTHDKNICTVAGGPAITTAYAEILVECDYLDAACYPGREAAKRRRTYRASPAIQPRRLLEITRSILATVR
jgi:anaerobic magnesium-protoporphyrin IX monomethyl ester cyclase